MRELNRQFRKQLACEPRIEVCNQPYEFGPDFRAPRRSIKDIGIRHYGDLVMPDLPDHHDGGNLN